MIERHRTILNVNSFIFELDGKFKCTTFFTQLEIVGTGVHINKIIVSVITEQETVTVCMHVI